MSWLEPSTGSMLGGTSITIHGQGFEMYGGGVVWCLFGNETSAGSVVSDNRVVCNSPQGQLVLCVGIALLDVRSMDVVP